MSARKYLFALVDAGGNIPPEIGAIRRLVERGHAVTALGDDTIAAEIQAGGAVFRPWIAAPNKRDHRPETDRTRDWECKYPWQLVKRLVQTQLVGPAPGYAADVRLAVADERPDVVVCSMFCIGAMVVAEARRIPYVLLIPNVYPMPAEGVPPFGMGLLPGRGFAGRWRDRAINALAEHLWNANGLEGLNSLRRAYGLPRIARFLDQARRATSQLVLTAPSFDFPAKLPPGASYVGPVVDDPLWARSQDWQPPPGSKPLVLVSLSSTYQNHVPVLRNIIEALETLPVRGLVTTGPAITPSAVPGAPNVTVTSSLPHGVVLKHANVVVSHGGHGTAIKALINGVPMVILPHGRDQADTAARVSARGAGVTLRRTSSPASIASAIQRILGDQRFRSAARSLGDAILRETQPDALALALEAVEIIPETDAIRRR